MAAPAEEPDVEEPGLGDSADMASAVVVRMPSVLPAGESGDHVDVVPAVVQLKGGMPPAFIVVGGDDGGQWRQFDPGG